MKYRAARGRALREDLDRPLSPGEQLEKARRLLEESLTDLQAAQDAEEELGIRRRASLACERAFHALVLLANAVLGEDPGNHSRRVMALEDAGRADLANVYERAKDALHTDGYHGQQLTRRQAERLQEV